MRIIHFCAGLGRANGMANTARQFVAEELAAGHESLLINSVEELKLLLSPSGRSLRVHIHGTWLPVLWKASRLAKAAGAELIIRPAGNYDPLRRKAGLVRRLKKLAAGPWEHRMLDRADIVQATCEEEAEWIRAYHPAAHVRITDLKRFFRLEAPPSPRAGRARVNILYLGRRDPLKGVEYLERAVREINDRPDQTPVIGLHLVSDKFGEELEKEWNWCEVMCLPTLSENFGRVVAEALERGKRVITTDGAPAWRGYFAEHPERGIYLEGYREGRPEERVKLLKGALSGLIEA